MLEILVSSPNWFHGFDVALEAISMLIAAGIFYAGILAWRFTKERKFLYFGGAFGLIAASFAGRLFAAATIALGPEGEGIVAPVLDSIGVGWRAFSLGRLVYIWLMLAAYSGLLGLALHWHRKREYITILGLVTVIAATSVLEAWPFYLASLILTFAIALQNYLNYAKNHVPTQLASAMAFALLSLEPLLYLLAPGDSLLIAAAYVARLVAFIMMFGILRRVLSHEPTTQPA